MIIHGIFKIVQSSYKTLRLFLVTVLCLPTISIAQGPTTPHGIFLKAFYPLDEPRFLCVDIPGHKERVNVNRPLTVHTCKEGIWHEDELIELGSIKQGQLKMPAYDLCIQPSAIKDGANLVLVPCIQPESQQWDYKNFRLALKTHPDQCLTIGAEPSELTPGGRRLPSRHRARSLQLSPCSENTFQRQMWRFESPQNRTTPIMPFAQ